MTQEEKELLEKLLVQMSALTEAINTLQQQVNYQASQRTPFAPPRQEVRVQKRYYDDPMIG